MTKAPRAGTVKTRLQPPLTAEEAAALNVCFLRDTAGAISEAGGLTQGVGVYTPMGEEDAYEKVLPPDFYLMPQRGEDFGERLTYAVEDLLRAGFTSCCLIDSDSPTVSAEVFREAVEVLSQEGERVVLGPSPDGGYYLIGMKRLYRNLFERIDWSTDRVAAQTLERARESGLEVHFLPPFSDVDDSLTLQRLCHEILSTEVRIAPETKTFLADLIARDGRARIWPEQTATRPREA